jgi:UDP-GlcNAc3NAcA epimerase
MKILTILGARPQFIKAATVSRQLKAVGIKEVIVHTGQHFDHNMSQVFFEEMDIPVPDYNLNINTLSHGAMTGRMMEAVEGIIINEKPEVVMVYGDTNSTLAGALAAVKLKVPVAHVEAGLRSFNMEMPEEINRILTDRISSHLFCPTQLSVQNLMDEGFENFNASIILSGDVMLDAALFYGAISEKKSTIIKNLSLKDGFVLSTIHRQENTDNSQRLSSIVDGLNQIHRSVPVVVPMHPRTAKILESLSIKPDFFAIDPVGYFDMVELIKHSSMVITDSGGLQKEAFFFDKPCITLREETEWVELVDNGFNTLSGLTSNDILTTWQTMSQRALNFNVDLYGNGKASERIAKYLQNL